MRHLLCSIVVCASFSVGLLIAQDSDDGSEFAAPASWTEYLDKTVTLGTWVSEGKTQAMWEGIPAGLKYSDVFYWEISDAGDRVNQNHLMKTDEGKVISSGAGYCYWDAETEKVLGVYSGFDTGKPFSGVATLLGINQETQTERWRWVETSRGKTTEYIIDRTSKTANEMSDSSKAAAGGDPWEVTRKRLNRLAAVTQLFDMNGTWVRETPSGNRQVSTATLALDGRALFWKDTRVEADGTSTETGGFVLYWDASKKRVRLHGLNQTGFSWQGELISLTAVEDSVTMVSRFSGSGRDGVTFSGIATRVLKGDTMTRKFTDVEISNRADTPSWVGEERTFKRTSR